MLSWVIAILVLIALVQLTFPNFISDAAGELQAHPWSNLGRGIAIHLLAVVLVGLFFASIVGIPVGAALMMATAVMWLFGLVTVSDCFGLYIRRWLRGSADVRPIGRTGWALAGAIILCLITLVPFVGMAIAGLAVAAGVGAAAAEAWQRLRTT